MTHEIGVNAGFKRFDLIVVLGERLWEPILKRAWMTLTVCLSRVLTGRLSGESGAGCPSLNRGGLKACNGFLGFRFYKKTDY
ncbi:MAG: hypothetical protein IPK63_14265 [Candidatus Competibacteraceae bacterium]|nr:hypothetical protein [Candidatus Competibacteraceae bacterium]